MCVFVLIISISLLHVHQPRYSVYTAFVFVGILPFNEEIAVTRRKQVPFGESSRATIPF